jgi:hypothetical protein
MRKVILAMGAVLLLVTACAHLKQSLRIDPLKPKTVQLEGFLFNAETNKLSITDAAPDDLLICVPSTAYHSKDGQGCTALRDVRSWLNSLARAEE